MDAGCHTSGFTSRIDLIIETRVVTARVSNAVSAITRLGLIAITRVTSIYPVTNQPPALVFVHPPVPPSATNGATWNLAGPTLARAQTPKSAAPHRLHLRSLS